MFYIWLTQHSNTLPAYCMSYCHSCSGTHYAKCVLNFGNSLVCGIPQPNKNSVSIPWKQDKVSGWKTMLMNIGYLRTSLELFYPTFITNCNTAAYFWYSCIIRVCIKLISNTDSRKFSWPKIFADFVVFVVYEYFIHQILFQLHMRNTVPEVPAWNFFHKYFQNP